MGKAQQDIAAHGSSHSNTADEPPVWPCLFFTVQRGVLVRTPLTVVFLEGNHIVNDQKGEFPPWLGSALRHGGNLPRVCLMLHKCVCPPSGGMFYLLTRYSLCFIQCWFIERAVFWAFPGENHRAVSSLWGRTEGWGGHSPSQRLGIHGVVIEGFRLKGARRAAGRGVAGGQETKAQNPAALLSLDSLCMPNAPSCALLSLATVCPLGTQAPVPARMSRPCLDQSAVIGQPCA